MLWSWKERRAAEREAGHRDARWLAGLEKEGGARRGRGGPPVERVEREREKMDTDHDRKREVVEKRSEGFEEVLAFRRWGENKRVG
jgi:hypothetical protein